MPLLVSPIDGSPMRQIHRYGIEIDVCPTSGGIWLDRGELEKILSILQEDLQAAAQSRMQQAAAPRHSHDDDAHGHHHRSHKPHDKHEYRKYDDDDKDERKYYGKPYKKDKMSRLFDIFDL